MYTTKYKHLEPDATFHNPSSLTRCYANDAQADTTLTDSILANFSRQRPQSLPAGRPLTRFSHV